jgi:ElaB/YqjD/DUF883 family membrane-anchored ribosome-binding protein
MITGRPRSSQISLQENASELARSVGDVVGKFIKEQPYTATMIAFGIGWLLGRTHRPR